LPIVFVKEKYCTITEIVQKIGKERAAVIYDYGNNDLFNNIKLQCIYVILYRYVGSGDEKKRVDHNVYANECTYLKSVMKAM